MAPLPAIVIDLRSVKPGETTEAGEVLTYIHTFDMALHVSLQGLTDDEAEDALEELMDTFTTALETQYGKQYKIEDWWPHDVPWGTNEALAGAFSLVIEQ